MLDRFERFSYAVSELSRCWHKIATDQLKIYGIKGPYAIYFTTLYNYKQGLTVTQLSELCGKDKADVSRAISILLDKELVDKESSPTGGYGAKIRLTKQGTDIAEKIIEKADLAVRLGGNGVSDENREIFYNSLEIIVSNLQQLSKEGLKQNK